MLKEKRSMQIKELIKQNGQVEISSLCRIFNVTEITIRRDLDNITKEDEKIVRIHGGAMLADEDMLIEAPIERRLVANVDKKEKIAKKALEYICTGNTVFFDSGSTTLTVARNTPNTLRIVALTNAINIASELITRAHISVIMIGGELRKNTHSCRGPIAEETLEKFHVDVAFLALNAVGKNGELFIANTVETGLKKRAMLISDKKYILTDSSKFDESSLCSFANVSDVDGIITDSGITEKQRKKLTLLGANIIIAD